MVENILKIVKFYVFLNYIYYVGSSSLDPLEVLEASGMDTHLRPWVHMSNYEEKVSIMEEKLKSLSENLIQLQTKMESMVNENMEKIEEQMKLIYNLNKDYEIQEIKCSNNRTPRDCSDLNKCNSNIYSILVPEVGNKSFPAVCDLKTLGGGWTVIHRRQDGSVNFYRNWTDYVEGFGDINGNFFIGLEKLYALTSLGKPQELYIILKDFEGATKYARYGEFKVDSESTDYTLTVGKYSGDAGDSLSAHSGHKFSTRDRDNDNHKSNCAEKWKGAWWYHSCYNCNLNGLYLKGMTNGDDDGRGMSWGEFRGVSYSLEFVQMMIRSK